MGIHFTSPLLHFSSIPILIVAMDFYFDNAATTPIGAKALEEYVETCRTYQANPSSIHREGLRAHAYLEENRSRIADILGLGKENIVFTSGATEAISIVMESLLWQKTPGRIITTRIEHEAVLSHLPLLKEKGWDIVQIKAKGGFVDPEDLANALDRETRLVAVMSVNNVTGAIQDIGRLVSIVREYEKTLKRKIFFFSDSVQALGKTGLDLKAWDVDGASFSAHKIAGPRGIGMLYLKNRSQIRPLAPAGGQESGLRGGTENLAAIASFRAALEETYADRARKEEKVAGLNRMVRSSLSADDRFSILSPEKASPYILSISTPLPSEVFTRMLIDRGFCVSSGSACSNNARKKASGVLEAMGFPPKTGMNSIRISFSDASNAEETELLIKTMKEIANG